MADYNEESMQSQPSSSKRKITEDPGGAVEVEEKKARMPESEAQPPHKNLRTLQDIFPTVDVAYLQQCCERFGDADIGEVISHLLDTPNKPQRAPQVHVEEPIDHNQLMPSYQDLDLQDILPDADPDFLRETWERVGSNQEELTQFVADAIEKRNYPKRENFEERQKKAELQNKVNEGFSIEGFLKMYPDPFKHFKNLQTNDKSTHSRVDGRSFLMARYPKISCDKIDRYHRAFNYSLLETCKNLEKLPEEAFMKKKRLHIPIYKNKTNMSFFHEIAFIENEAKISQHIKDKEDRRKEMFEEAKAKGELLACGCCYADELLRDDIAACENGHIFCKECIKKGAEVEIGKGNTKLPCLMNCGHMISLQTMKEVLQPSVFKILDRRIQMEEVKAAGIEDFETCPFCDFGTIPSPNDKVFKCLNPDCMKESCRLCKEVSHIPLRCDEVEKSEEVKVRTYIEDRMTEALARTCWRCKKKFIKTDGCNFMTCTCGAHMCYLCRQPLYGFLSFFHRCASYSTDKELHVDAVIKEAKKAKKYVESKYPQLSLKHDPTKILPTTKDTSKW